MKLTKKLEAEVLKAYKAYWDAYLNGDMKSFASMLADNITVFGTAVSEVFKNKKETLRFYKATAVQLVGKAQFRNRQINVQAVDNNILVNEQSDFYFLMDRKWTYYGPARVSAILTKTRSGWKLAHQHASFPDTRADEGEQFATEKIKAENQQLRDAVKRRTIQLEETNRELEIESALERVRAVAMGMKKPGDMLTVCNVISKQLEQLGIRNIRNVQTVIFNSSTTIYLDYEYYPLKDQNIITQVDYMLQPDVKAFAKKMMKAPDTFYTRSFKGAGLTKWNRYQKKTKQVIDPRQHKATGLHFYFYSIGVGALGISVFTPLSNDEIRMFKRFRNVFELAYRRFTDIQKAEAQAREARIEVAVERVRAKALAMHRSDEIHGVVRALRNELFGLKLEGIIGATICLKQADGLIRFWDITDVETTGRYGWDIVFDIDKIDSRLWVKKIWDSRKQIISTEQDSSDLKRALKWLGQYDKKTANEILKLLKINNIKHGWHRAVRLAHGRLITDFANEPPSEIDSILLKIGVAFDLAYRRFLDLQKAEAQAREAQIEAALEKIRSRSLAMHQSKELKDVIATLFEKLGELNVLHGTVAIQLFDHASMNSFLWVGNAIQDPQMVNLPYDKKMMLENTYVKDGWEAMREGRDIINKEYSLKEKNKFFKYVFANNDMTQVPEGAREVLRKIRRHIVCLFTEKNSALFVDSFDGQFFSKENLAIIKRAGKVFEQCYIRFLDLQKAETQAREAQIEASLERVRAKTMGMHKSSDLLEVVKILGEQLELLGVEFDSVNFNTNYLEKDWNLWLYNSGVPMYPDKLHIPYLDHPCFNRPKEAYKEGTDFQSFVFTKEEKDSLFDHIYTNSIARNVPEERKKYTYAGAGLVWSIAFTKHTSVTVSNYRAEPFTEEENAIFRRFANVFEQSYTRFLDLQNAEAQAREAQIEAALERVRARTMGMHQSKELHDVIETVTNQLLAIGLKFDNSVFCRVNEDLSWEMWMSTPQQSYPSIIHIPYLDHRVFNNLREIKAKNIDFFTDVFDQNEARAFFKHFFENTIAKNAPEERKQYVLSRSGFARSLFFIKNIWFVISRYVPEPFSAEENAVLKRFAKVFEQSYTRFLDLQKAEAQAREAEIELALERVRARTMAMQKPAEFNEVIDVIGEQFLHLGFDIQWATFSAKGLDIASGLDLWIFAVIPGLFRSADRLFIPRTHHPIFAAYDQALKDYQTTGKDFFVMTFGKSDKDSWLDHLHDTTTYKDLPPELLAIDYDKPGYTNSVVMLKDTWLSIGKHDSIPFNDEQNVILKRFSVAFGQAYTRFLDLQKAEAQAREAQIEAALERVRSRTMGMQKSEELKEVIQVVYEQFVQLNIHVEHTGFIVDYKASDDMHIWLADKHAVPFLPLRVTIPYFDSAHWNSFNEAKEKGIDFFANQLSFEEKNKFYQDLFKLIPGVPEETLRYYFSCPGLAISTVLLENVGLYIENFSGIPYTDEENNTLMRFGKVFQQTYTRFLDLQKAEAQAREAHIEAALERVRSRSMGMQKSDELAEVVAVLYKQFEALDFGLYQVLVSIYDKKNNVIEWWSRGFGDIELPQRNIIPIIDHPFCNDLLEKWENGAEYYPHLLEGEMKRSWDEYLFTGTDLKNFPQQIKDTMRGIDKVYVSDVFMKYGSLQAAGPAPLADDKADILKRFVKVLDLAYTRMKDLQTAEMQAREAQIELGLERVRSRAMAMQTSEELNELIGTVFTELTKLDLVLTRCVILIYEGNEKGVRWWMANSEAPSMPASFFVKYTKLPFFNEYLQGWYDRSFKWQYILEGENKIRTDDFLFNETELSQLPDFVIKGMRAPEKVYLNASFNNFGNLTLASLEPLSNEHFDILLRFAKVFDLTYTRFNDLKQAEAQARESQIQLALERVRARTMAMQKSDELPQAANLLFQQVQSLGMPAWSAGYCTWDDDKKNSISLSMSSEGVLQPTLSMPLTEDPSLMHFREAWERGETFFVEEVGGEELKRHYAYLRTLPGVKETLDEVEAAGFPVPTFQIFHLAYFSKGFLLFITYEPVPESHDIFKRFGKVFDQTYTRFLDLQKAEAQAREAQIEAALERVRSRAMAMHKTEELLDAAELVFKELTGLGITSMNISYAFVDEQEKYGSYYSVTLDGKALPFPFVFPHTETKVMRALLSNWKKQVPFGVIELDEEATLNHQTYIAEHIQKQFAENNPGIPFSVEAFLEASPQKAVIYNFNFAQGYIFVIGSKRLTTEQEHMMLRFTKVFELAYRRFLDIKQAEAQAREAQIELALERVRARTMAMHQSEELAETAQVMFHQLQELGGIPNRMSIGVANEESGVVNFWTTDQSGSHINNSFAARLNEKTVIEKTYKAWKENKKSLVIDLHGDEVKEWIRFAREEMNIVVDDKQIKDRRVHTLAFFSHGWILVTTHEPQTAETIQILERFASVFNLTYRRFLDLQKAEAQANEARIEISLERIRARALAMHKSDELIEVAKVLWEQMALLGQPELEASVVHLYEYDPDHIISSRAVSIGTDSSAKLTYGQMAIPKNSCEVVKEWLEKFYSDSKEYTIELSGAKQKEWYDLMGKLAPDVVNSMRQKNILSEKRFYRFSKFSGGALLMVSTQEPSLEVAYLQKRAAAVFDLAYRRFSDLQKTEAQARESEIELALERVRAKSMSMRHSDELADLVRILFKELNSIGFPINGCIIMTYDERTNDSTWWIANSDGVSNPLGLLVPNHSHAPYQAYLKEWKKQTPKWSYRLGGAEKKKWDQYVFTNSGLAALPDPVKAGMQSVEDVQLNVCFNKYASITFGSLDPMGDKDFDILHRFAKVFEQSYTRFLDLQNAEAQAREAKIEAALERVRAKAMAMHRSEDLHEAVKIMFEEFQKLNLDVLRCGVGILNKNSRTGSVWATSVSDDGLAVQISADESFETHPLMMLIYEYWQKQEDLEYILQGQDLINYYRAMKESDLKLPESQLSFSEDELQPQYYYGTMFKAGGLYAFKEKSFAEEEKKIMKRFASVVNLTYNRFLDLQKAEASAREAQIEASLERVRSKTMAMHNSNDVGETVSVMFDELVKLGIETIRCGIAIIHDTKEMEVWTARPGDDGKVGLTIGRLDMNIHQLLRKVYNEWKNKVPFSTYELVGEDLKDYFRAINNSPDYPVRYDIESVPSRQVNTAFFFPEGALFAFSQEPVAPEAANILKRFAGVFGQTYRRYLDLQKAEANAREAQIEAGLERVRARTMAMHSSDDVSAATATMFTELEKLGIENLRGGITIIRPDQTQEVWSITNLPDGTTIRSIGVFDMKLHPLWQALFKAQTNNESYNYYWLAGKEKEDYISLLNATPNYLAQQIKEIPDVHVQSYFFGEGGVWTNSLQPHSEDEKQIMKRFASVFSLTFRRYQDLKKAEAQAREATIEAALEKVRGQAMAMHNSNDLSVTTSIIIGELKKLGITPIRCGVGIINRETHKAQLYTARFSPDGDSLSVVGWALLKGHPVLENIYEKWSHGEDYFPELSGDSLKSYYQQLLAGLSVPLPEFKDGQTHYGHFFSVSVGCLYAWADVKYNDDEIKILKRFASIIDLTFRRYFELQKSEANAREAVKQAALDRVRADIASMRTVSDLDRITPLIWKELTILDVPFIRCGVFIMDETQKLIHTFLSTPEGKAIAAFHLPYNTPGNVSKVLENWQYKKIYVDHWDKEEFSQFADILLKQGTLSSREQYLKTIPEEGFYLHFLPFLQGMLYVGNTEQLNEEQIELIQHVADAFSTAYARYEDFNKLEAAKQQVENTLTDLKQAQQQLVQSEKMASLGELTAGIAHEIQNPLNFVNNFSDVSNELLEEMKAELEKGNKDDAIAIVEDVKQNLEKILHHGKRADAIVKGMLQHSRTSSGQKEPTDINILADEYLRLSFHGLRAKDKSFNAKFETHFDNSIGKVSIIPQDIGRVILNLINNAFYAVTEKKKHASTDSASNGYEPTVTVTTKKENGKIEIKVKDNGSGIPQKVLDKIFQPFFTTKPTGQGTGLGLSLAYDIITKGHGGELKVETKEGEGSEFVIQLPGL